MMKALISAWLRTVTSYLRIRVSVPSMESSGRVMAGRRAERLVWVDLEMTGLDVTKDHIMEIACIITDRHLNIVAEGPDIIIHQPDDILEGMNEWCIDHHGQSGLTTACRESATSLTDTEQQLLAFVKEHVPEGRCPLAGNTVYMDKRFLERYMPRVIAYLHFRIVDVSSVKELCRRWYPREFTKAPKKQLKHRALEDIKESIAELKYYKETIFKRKEK